MKSKIINWIKEYFRNNGNNCKAVIGISGGTDSTVCAALCVEALGTDNVIGVLMPQGHQRDIYVARKVVKHLGIKNYTINIADVCDILSEQVGEAMQLNANNFYVYHSNTPARIRMTTLYGISAIVNGRVVNTCNLSEDYIGYSTKYGDSAGDFSPLAKLTKTEVKQLGVDLGLPKEFVYKTPEDGLSGKTDEENFGFSYDVLDRYIRTGQIDDFEIKEKIESMHKKSLHKIMPMPYFDFE